LIEGLREELKFKERLPDGVKGKQTAVKGETAASKMENSQKIEQQIKQL